MNQSREGEHATVIASQVLSSPPCMWHYPKLPSNLYHHDLAVPPFQRTLGHYSHRILASWSPAITIPLPPFDDIEVVLQGGMVVT